MATKKARQDGFTLTLPQARRAAIAAQRLSRDQGSLVDILDQTGFIRTLGGADVYVAARARVPQLTRQAMDAAVEARELCVLPTVRGCIYLVAGRHAAPSLRLADLLSRRRAEREHEKAGIQPGEIETIGRAVIKALAEGPLTTAALRKRLPENLVRSLGDAGKKIGISSPLPPTLRRLEFDGTLERLLDGGRLDTERYLWGLTDENLFHGFDADPQAIHTHMAQVYLKTAGFGTRKGFAAWAGLGQKDSKAALESLDTLSLTVEGVDEPYTTLRENRVSLESPPATEPVAFLPFEDTLLAVKQGPAFFVDPEHHSIPVPVWGRTKGTTLGDARHSALRPIIAESRLVGFWELDPDAEQIVTGVFADISPESQDRIQQEAEELNRFLVEQLGHGRSFSLDSEKHLRARCEHIRNCT